MKTCIACKQAKDESEYYAHPQMKDGLLGRCKDCHRENIARNYEIKKKDPDWVERERARCRAKMAAYRAAGLEIKRSKYVRIWEKNNKHKKSAATAAARAQRRGLLVKPQCCEHCKQPFDYLEKHHEDYSKPLEVTWLCVACHGLTRRKSKYELP